MSKMKNVLIVAIGWLSIAFGCLFLSFYVMLGNVRWINEVLRNPVALQMAQADAIFAVQQIPVLLIAETFLLIGTIVLSVRSINSRLDLLARNAKQ